ncbi:MAG: SxtJ family membrane protein [Candidatus Omnitrophota bacterium]
MIDDIKKIKSGKKELREFGLTVGLILAILGGIALWRGKPIGPYLLVPGILLAAAGIFMPHILKPLQKIWMGLAIVIGFFVSRIILSILFFLVMTPIGVMLRLCGKDILDQRMEREKDSYWHRRGPEKKTKESYNNQY